MTKEQAVEFYNSKKYETMSNLEIVKFQLFEPKMCMPFPIFQAAVEDALGRPVYTHEFADAEKLRTEFKQKVK